MTEFQTKEEILEEMERTKWKRTLKTLIKDWRLYVLLLPTIVFFALFRYKPMLGLLVAFKNQGDAAGGSTGEILFKFDFYGFEYVRQTIFGTQAARFWGSFVNTFVLSLYGLCFGFPLPIILALFFSEIKNNFYRSVTQVFTYLPHFVSTVVTTTIVIQMLKNGGLQTAPGILANIFYKLGVDREVIIMLTPKYFRAIYEISGIWEGTGYSSIVYFAAIMAISPTNYEAAKIDGANKIAQVRHVTLPGMAPTLTIMLILRIGNILSVGYEKVLLLTGDSTEAYDTAEVLSLYVYNVGLNGGETNNGTVADLFNAVIAMFLVLGANFISRRVSDTALF